ncbi:MAG: hypothetical protein C0485_05585 [Pirellula sp.]|nr:hypothetical protein [Pirellula sp.]
MSPVYTRWSLLVTLAVFGSTGSNRPVAAQEPVAENIDGVEVLTRGPLHEAFAETVLFDPEPGIVISQAPPEPIEEVAPAQRPEGPDVAWIPGYWSWDDERNDFLWISGIWRALPPGRQWIPGYWSPVEQGSQWISGYWADAAVSEIEYLPEPPATVEAGPNIESPSADHVWLPGCWIWQQNRYAWQPGYWAPGNQNWDWVPAHYVWTPGGYVFVDGYYDYSVRRRGVVFAPVYFNQGIRNQRGYSYSPSTVINSSVFISHLFLRPSHGHYYFGDYYGSKYADAGYSPWFSYQSNKRGYDPIYVNQRWQHRDEGGWEQRAQTNYENRRDNENARPPRNWAAQAALASQVEASQRKNMSMASQLDEMAKRKNARVRLQQVDDAERQSYSQRGHDYRKYLQQRQQLEANPQRSRGAGPDDSQGPERRTFSKSPYAAPPIDQFRGDLAPPQRHEARQPDLRVQPQPRTKGNAPGTRAENVRRVPNDASNRDAGNTRAKPKGDNGKQPLTDNNPPKRERGGEGAKSQGGKKDKPQGKTEKQAKGKDAP